MIDIKKKELKEDLTVFLKKYVSLLKKSTSRHIGKIVLVGLILGTLFLLHDYFVILLLAALTASTSTLVSRLGLNRFGIELSTFSTVLMAFVSEPETAAMLGLLFICSQAFTGNGPGVYMLWVVPSFGIAGYLISIMGSDIVVTGVFTAAILQLVFIFFTVIMMRNRVHVYIQYAVFNVVFNGVLFLALGPEALHLISSMT